METSTRSSKYMLDLPRLGRGWGGAVRGVRGGEGVRGEGGGRG